MKRLPKILIACSVAFFFASAVLCATLAAPGQSLASFGGCAQDNHAKEMAGCDHPGYLCSFNRSSHLVSEGSLTWARSTESPKDILAMAVGEPILDYSAYGGVLAWNEHTNGFPTGPQKVSIHLYNSVLTL